MPIEISPLEIVQKGGAEFSCADPFQWKLYRSVHNSIQPPGQLIWLESASVEHNVLSSIELVYLQMHTVVEVACNAIDVGALASDVI